MPQTHRREHAFGRWTNSSAFGMRLLLTKINVNKLIDANKSKNIEHLKLCDKHTSACEIRSVAISRDPCLAACCIIMTPPVSTVRGKTTTQLVILPSSRSSPVAMVMHLAWPPATTAYLDRPKAVRKYVFVRDKRPFVVFNSLLIRSWLKMGTMDHDRN